MAKSLTQWLSEYSESHQNPTNKWIHYICVPIIFFSIYVLLFLIPTPFPRSMYLNWGSFVYIIALVFWFRLNFKVGFTFLLIGFLMGLSTMLIWYVVFRTSDFAMMRFFAILFVLAWIGQFIGHQIEGKKPSFLKDLQFLLIGPIWILFPQSKVN